VLSRRFVGVLLAMAIGWLPTAPPEHVHEAEEHGHQHLLIHRHLAAHHGADHAVDHDGVFDDDDTPILTLDPAFTVPGTISIDVAHATVAADLEPPLVRVPYRTPKYLGRLIHGPPRAPTGLRAPPSLSRL